VKHIREEEVTQNITHNFQKKTGTDKSKPKTMTDTTWVKISSAAASKS